MRPINKISHATLVIVAVMYLLMLAACGGGGGGNNSGTGANSGNTDPNGGNPVPDSGDSFLLSIKKFGDGRTTSNTGGIDCGENCSGSFKAGSTVILTASPDAGAEFLHWAGCDLANGNSCTITMDSDKIVLPTFGMDHISYKPEAIILDDAIMQQLIKQEGTTYYFEAQAETITSLLPGNIIVSNSGEGLLRKVVSVNSSSGAIVLETEDATFEDFIEEGTVAWTKMLSQADLQYSKDLSGGSQLRKTYMKSARSTTGPADALSFTLDINATLFEDEDGAKVEVIGSSESRFSIDFASSYGVIGINEFKTAFITDTTHDLELKITKKVPIMEIEKAIHSFYFTPIPINAFMVIVPQVVINVGVKGEAEGSLTSAISLNAVATAGVYYKKGNGWSPIGDYTATVENHRLETAAQASMIGYLSPEFSIKINAVAGPLLSAQGYLKAQSGLTSTNATDPLWWKIYAGVGAHIGAKVEIFSWLLAKYDVEIYSHEWQLAAGEYQPPTDNTPPSIPLGLSATAASDNQINLNWYASADNAVLAGYKVYRDGALLAEVSALSYVDTGLLPDTEYCYAVSAYDEVGNESGKSTSSCVRTRTLSDTTAPSIPVGLQASVNAESQIDLSWEASTDNQSVAGYKIYRNGVFAQSVVSTSFSDSGLAGTTQYCYQVAAFDDAGNESARSLEVCATTTQCNLCCELDGEEDIGLIYLRNELNIEVTPSWPDPDQLVTIELSMYTEDLEISNITWCINGGMVLTGIGEDRYTFRTGQAGQITTVKIIVELHDGRIFSRTFHINPAYIDLATKINYDAGYVEITATPVIIVDGRQLSAETLVYAWNTGIGITREYGLNVFIVWGRFTGSDMVLRVQASTVESNAIADGSIVIPAELLMELYLIQMGM